MAASDTTKGDSEKMVMSKTEILRDWEGAKDKKAQIQILADLNCTTPEAIKEVLREMGVDGRQLPREKKHEKAEETPKTQPELLRAKNLEKAKDLEAPKPGKPKVEPRRKHALRRMEELFQAIVTQELVDDVPDRDWVEEFHDLWTEYYYKHWGDMDE